MMNEYMSGRKTLRLALWGATGATGGEVLLQCLQEPQVDLVRVFTRRLLPEENEHVQQVQVDDFLELSAHRNELRGIDVAFWCLGVSQSAVPQEGAYREITRDFALAAARALREESPQAEFYFLSGMGADPKSRLMWARVKGQTEVDLLGLGLRRVVVVRPSYIYVTRGRTSPSLTDRVWRALSPALRLWPNLTNTTVDIAHSMIHCALAGGEANATLSARDVNRMAGEYRGSRSTAPD